MNDLVNPGGRTGTPFGNLAIGTGSTLAVGAGPYDLEVQGDWTSDGTFTPAGGKVTLLTTKKKAAIK